VKLLAHRAALPGKEISFILCFFDPAYKARPAEHLPAKNDGKSPEVRVLTQNPAGLPPRVGELVLKE
jgi:hypothetical protein